LGKTASLFSAEQMSGEESAFRDEFGLVANFVGLSDEEPAALLGAKPKLSRVILALETVNAALELFGAPETTAAWLRGKSPDEPFNQRSPLQAMAEEGSLGVEIVLLHLRARLRVAPYVTANNGSLLTAAQSVWPHGSCA
jgi:hypothetical protein